VIILARPIHSERSYIWPVGDTARIALINALCFQQTSAVRGKGPKPLSGQRWRTVDLGIDKEAVARGRAIVGAFAVGGPQDFSKANSTHGV